jgi:FKBP-type peptidyl-prolyl cis-trans isomerase
MSSPVSPTEPSQGPIPPMPWEPNSPTPKSGARKRRRWLGITAAVGVVALIGGGVAYFERSGPNWYANGQSVELAAEQHDDALVAGPVSTLPKACTARMDAAQPSQRPANTDTGAVQQWLQGCEAEYNTMQKNGGPAQPGAPVTVEGTFGTSPDVTIPATTPPSSLYIKTLYEGTGATVTSSEGVVGNYISYDWSPTTNKQLASSFTGTPSIFVGQLLPGLEQALVGQKVGSRVVAAMPPADGYGSAGNFQVGIEGTDTLVFVVDILAAT